MQDISNYEKIRGDANNFYQKIGNVRCPALGDGLVYFTAEGFNHLLYKNKRNARSREHQITKFKLLPKALHLIKTTTTHQEYDESLITIRRKKFKKMQEETVVAKYWGLIAIMDGFRVKVIIRQIGHGQKHFWSVIPAWNTSQYRNIKILLRAKGDLAED